MSSAYLRAIRGPVLLMLLGVLMLADYRAGMSFWRTWPLLLVAAGLMVLAERASMRENPWQAGPQAPPPPFPPSSIAYRPFGHPEPEAPPAAHEGTEGETRS